MGRLRANSSHLCDIIPRRDTRLPSCCKVAEHPEGISSTALVGVNPVLSCRGDMEVKVTEVSCFKILLDLRLPSLALPRHPSQTHSPDPQCFPTQGSVRLRPEHRAALPSLWLGPASPVLTLGCPAEGLRCVAAMCSYLYGLRCMCTRCGCVCSHGR